MATLNLKKTTTVAELKKEFNENFGSQVRLYSGRSQAEATATLQEIGLTAEGVFGCRSSLTVASFIERMQAEFGLKVKVYTCDDWVACLDGLTLESTGKVKKNAVKADMESMIAYQRNNDSANDLNGYSIVAKEDGGYSVYQNGVLCSNAKGAMREMAALIGMEYDEGWTTRQFGAKLVKAIDNGEVIKKPAQPTPAPQVDNTAEIVAAKAAAEKAKQEADAAKAKAEAEAAKAAADKAKAEAAAMAAAKAAADKARAEVEKQKAEAEAANAELARIQAEIAKAKAEAEAAKVAAEKAQEEAKKAAETPAPATPTKTSNNKGALNGLFSVAPNKKVRFSMGNLQFNAKKYEFRFAEHQYDRIGDDNTKIAANYDGWIDLFGFGTSGYMGCEPFETSRNSDQYPNQSIDNTNYDWGVYNPIVNGGNKEGLWRTLTKYEWDYLLQTRPNAKKLLAKACVNHINGYIFLPDDFFEHRVRVPFDSTPNNFSGNTYDLTQWATLEAAGAVFLPCVGSREGTTMSGSLENNCHYWSASNYGSGYAYIIYINTRCNYRCFGCGVRLVQDVK